MWSAWSPQRPASPAAGEWAGPVASSSLPIKHSGAPHNSSGLQQHRLGGGRLCAAALGLGFVLAAGLRSARKSRRAGGRGRGAAVLQRRSVAAPGARGGQAKSIAGIKIAGTGSAAPSCVISNDDLSEIMETSDEWISQRTGIRRRHILQPNESLTEISSLAAKRALEAAGMAGEDVELVILATSTPDDLFGCATHVAAEIGAAHAVAFDLTAACSGWVFAMVTAAQYVRSGAVSSALVVGADCLSRFVDWNDRGTCVLFGDGAGATVIKATDAEHDALIGFEMGSRGEGAVHLGCVGKAEPISLGGGKEGGSGSYSSLSMNGKEVYRFATTSVPTVLSKLLETHSVPSEDVDWLVLHQANRRIMDSAAKRLKLPKEKIICNLDEYGNTSAASIPLAMDEAVKEGKIKPGQLMAIAGFGAGLSWGGMLLRY